MKVWHDDVIKWKHFPRNWPFVREIHRSPVNFPHKGQWRGALMFSLIYAWIYDWVNNHEAGDLRRQHGHYDVIVMSKLAVQNRNKTQQNARHIYILYIQCKDDVRKQQPTSLSRWQLSCVNCIKVKGKWSNRNFPITIGFPRNYSIYRTIIQQFPDWIISYAWQFHGSYTLVLLLQSDNKER